MPIDTSAFDKVMTSGSAPGDASPTPDAATGSGTIDTSAFDETMGRTAAPAPAARTDGRIDTSAFDASMGRPSAPTAADEGPGYRVPESVDEHEKGDIEDLAAHGKQKVVTSSDLEYIARKHGVDPGYLRSAAGWLGGIVDPDEETTGEWAGQLGKATLGEFGESVLFGAPQGVYKKFIEQDPHARMALDDLHKLIDERKTGARKVAEFGLGFAGPGGFAGNVIKKGGVRALGALAAETGGIGAATGYLGSDEGHETFGTIAGGITGSLFGLALHGVMSAAAPVAKKGAAKFSEWTARTIGTATEDAAAAAEQAFQKNADAEATLSDVVLQSHGVRAAVRQKDYQAFFDSAELDPDEVVKLASLWNPDAPLSKDVQKAMGDDAAKAWQVVREASGKFDAKVNPGAQGGVDARLLREGGQHVVDSFERMRMEDYTQKALLAAAPESGFGSLNVLQRASQFFSDARYVVQRMDDRLGLRLLPTFDKLSVQYNHYTRDMAAASVTLGALNGVRLAAEKKPMLNGEEFNLYTILDTHPDEVASMEHLFTPEQKAAVNDWRAGFDALRAKAEELGLPIEKLEGYVPKQMVKPVEYVRRMDDMTERLGIDLEDDSSLQRTLDLAASHDSEAPTPESKEAADWVHGLELAGDGEINTVEEARTALQTLEDPTRAGGNVETKARASFLRDGEIPDFLLEKDPTKLFASWAQNTFRHVRFRGVTDEVLSMANAIDSGYGKNDYRAQAAQYLRDHITDLTGIRGGTMGELQSGKGTQFAIKWDRAARIADKQGRPVKAWQYRFISGLPDLIPSLASNMYLHSLGFRPSKGLEYMFQPYMLGLSEHGLGVGKYFLGAQVDAVKQFGQGLPRWKVKQFLNERGLSGASTSPQMNRWLRGGLEQSSIRRGGQQLLDAVTHVGMSFYEAGDEMGRLTTYFASQRIMEAAMKGDSHAMAVLEKMPVGYRNQVNEKLAHAVVLEKTPRGEQDLEAVRRLKESASQDVATWMNGYTQYNYNKASMSEFGRTFGPMFSMFTKWPTSVAGDIAYGVDRAAHTGEWGAESKRLAQKYLAPFLSLYLVSVKGEDWLQDHPRARAALGGEGPSHMAPITSVPGLVNGPPLLRTGWAALRGVGRAANSGFREGDWGAAARHAAGGAVQTLYPLAPGGLNLLARFLTQDIPDWTGRERSEGGVAGLFADDVGDFGTKGR